MYPDVLIELLEIQPDRIGVAVDIGPLQIVLMREQLRTHLKVLALQARGLGGACRVEGAGVRPLQRQMAPYIAEVVAEMRPHFVDSASGAATEGAFIVPVLDQRERGIGVAAHVVAFGIDGPDELETDGFGRTEQIGDVEDRPAERRRR